MKKVFSILTVTLLFTAMLHISVAKHYCGGELVASKISLTGGLASCGMEGAEESCPLESMGDHLNSHCCDDFVTYYSIDNNYIHNQTLVPESYKFVSQVLEITVAANFHFSNLASQVFTSVSPPAYPMISAVDLTDICVFRI